MLDPYLFAPPNPPIRTSPAPTDKRESRILRRHSRQLHRRKHVLCEVRAIAVAQERNRLGREMHDRLGQSLACASAYSSAAADMLATGEVEAANWAVQQTVRALDQAYRDLRESICALRTADVDPAAWVIGLRGYAAFYQQQWGIRCDVDVDEAAVEACDAESRVALTRILQEALSKIRKHARTDRATVSIALADGWMVAEVVDYGCGFDVADRPAGHYGLETMQERAAALGGGLTITGSRTGTRLSVRLPVGTRVRPHS